VWRWVLREGDPRRLAWLGVAGAFLIGAAAFGLRVQSKGIRQAVVWLPSLAERQLAAWSQSHTAIDSTFLVNPNWGDFRALSKRPVFVTWKDGSALLWYRPFAGDWAKRLRELGYDVEREPPPGTRISSLLDTLYESLTDRRAQALCRHYGLRYWAVRAQRPSQFPCVYRNRLYKVLDLHTPT